MNMTNDKTIKKKVNKKVYNLEELVFRSLQAFSILILILLYPYNTEYLYIRTNYDTIRYE